MDWIKFGWAAFMLLLLIAVFPRALQAYKNAPSASLKHWLGAIVPMLAVLLFVYLLIIMARGS